MEQQRAALLALHTFLLEEQGTIDAMLTLSKLGLGDAPLPALAALLEPDLEPWQREELGETLGELLDAIHRFVQADYSEEWERTTRARFSALLDAARQVERALERVDGPDEPSA